MRSVALFIRVAHLGAIGRAGAEFGLSPTAATQRIQALEAALGATLLTRTTRSIALTADGDLFLGHAKKIIADIEDAQADLQGADGQAKGELRVTASASFGRLYVTPHIPAFLAQYPAITVRLDLTDAIVDIVERGYDLALRVGVLMPSTLMARKLLDNPRLLVAAPAYLEKHPAPATPKALRDHNCITLGETRSWSLQAADGSITESKISGNFSTNYGEAVTEAALGGTGIALKSQWDIKPYLEDGRLCPVLADYTILPQWAVWAVRPPSRTIPARVRLFTEFMESKFRNPARTRSC